MKHEVPGTGGIWFSAGNYEVKKPSPLPPKEYLFDSDSSEEEEPDVKIVAPEDTILVYQLQGHHSASPPLIPSFIAKKIPVPLSTPSGMRTLSFVPPIPDRSQRNSFVFTSAQDGNGERGKRGAETYQGEEGEVVEDPRSLDADPVAMAKEAERLQMEKPKRENEKTVTFSLISEVKRLPQVSLAFPILTVLIDLAVAVIAVVSMLKTDGDAASVSVFVFLIVGIIIPNSLALFCIFKNKLWHSAVGFQVILWPTVMITTIVPFTTSLLLLHPILMILLGTYILCHRKGMRTTRGTFVLLRNVREEQIRQSRQQLAPTKVKNGAAREESFSSGASSDRHSKFRSIKRKKKWRD